MTQLLYYEQVMIFKRYISSFNITNDHLNYQKVASYYIRLNLMTLIKSTWKTPPAIK